MIARRLLPASPAYLLDRQDRAITSARPRSVSRHVGRPRRLSVSNSSSGRRWKLDHAPAVGDPTHMVEFGTGRRAFAREA